MKGRCGTGAMFNYHKRANTRVFVYFGAANYQSTVYLNGEKLGEHEGGFTAFNFEATSVLRDGENFLIVEVSNARRADAVPALKFDWWSYGGITRDVMLVEVPTMFIQDYSLQLVEGSQNEIAGWVQLNGAPSPQKITLEIPEAGVHETVTSDADGAGELSFPGQAGAVVSRASQAVRRGAQAAATMRSTIRLAFARSKCRERTFC